MARPLRIEFAGATHHVMARGWVAERLRMGYETRAGQAVRVVQSSREPALTRTFHGGRARSPSAPGFRVRHYYCCVHPTARSASAPYQARC